MRFQGSPVCYTAFSVVFATATITLTREDDGSPCSSSIVLTCSYQNTQLVRIEECAANTMHFTLVTRTIILGNPDFEEVISAELGSTDFNGHYIMA